MHPCLLDASLCKCRTRACVFPPCITPQDRWLRFARDPQLEKTSKRWCGKRARLFQIKTVPSLFSSQRNRSGSFGFCLIHFSIAEAAYLAFKTGKLWKSNQASLFELLASALSPREVAGNRAEKASSFWLSFGRLASGNGKLCDLHGRARPAHGSRQLCRADHEFWRLPCGRRLCRILRVGWHDFCERHTFQRKVQLLWALCSKAPMGFLIYGALGSIAGMGVGALARNQALFFICP